MYIYIHIPLIMRFMPETAPGLVVGEQFVGACPNVGICPITSRQRR